MGGDDIQLSVRLDDCLKVIQIRKNAKVDELFKHIRQEFQYNGDRKILDAICKGKVFGEDLKKKKEKPNDKEESEDIEKLPIQHDDEITIQTDSFQISVQYLNDRKVITIRKNAQVEELFKHIRQTFPKIPLDWGLDVICNEKIIREDQKGDIETLGIRRQDFLRLRTDYMQISVWLDDRAKYINIKKDATVSELFKHIRQSVENIGDSEFSVIYDGIYTLYGNEKGTIGTLGIQNLTTFHLVIKTSGGGAKQSSTSEYNYVPPPTRAYAPVIPKVSLPTPPILPSPPILPTLSKEKCCIFGDDGEEDDCYKMPCGCAYSVMAIKAYCDKVVYTDRNFTFSCQVCFKSWSCAAVRHVISEFMEDDELTKFNEKLNDNYAAMQLTIRKCPTCNNLITRDFTKHFLNPYYVKCTLCTHRTGRAVEFCWCCLNPWSSGTTTSCGNNGCIGKDPRVRFLETCETKIIGEVSDVPIVRACGKCRALIQHANKCKHMSCKCGYAFCFVCLKPFDLKTEKWSCGSWNAKCPVAPRQIDIFK